MNPGIPRPARRGLFTVGLAAVLLSAACSTSATGQEAASEKTTKVTLAIPAPSELFNLPVVLADELGYYAEEGLDVNLIDFQVGSTVLQAVLAGDADAASGFYGHTIMMAAKGQPIRSFVTTINTPGLVLAVSPATRRPIKHLADLKGAVVGVSAPGSGSHIFLQYLLRRHGVAPDDVAVSGIGLAGTAVAAMERGRVDAAIMLEPALSQLQQRMGKLVLLVDTRTQAGVSEIFGTDGYPGIALYARSKWLAENQATATKLAAAVTRALHWIHDHSAEEIADAMPEQLVRGDRALYVTTVATAKSTVSTDGRMHVEGAEAVRRMLAVSVPEVADADIDLTATYTNEFLQTG
jgi:NitT/TauT family transport system substrate-binding protein